MADLEPITRDEMLWSGEDLEPKTRREMYIRHLYDETQVIPDSPITREEMFILKAGEELHDVTIEQLTATENRTYSEAGVAYSPVIVNVPQTTLTTLDVTENGTYTAPSGTAYDEVDVDVPLPDNAYLVKDIANTPSSIATFTDGSPLPMPKLEVAVEPQQDLHGYDAPWVGGAGKNKFDESNFNDDTSWQYYTLTLNPNTTYTASSNNGNYYEDNTFPQLYVYATGSGAGSNNAVYTGHSVNITTGSDGVLKVQWKTNNNSKKMTSYHLQVEQGNQATSYAPYSNICPISGWTECKPRVVGSNLLNTSGTDTNNGYVYGKSLNTGGVIGDNYNGFITEYSEVIPNETHIISGISGINTCLCIYDENKTFIESIKYDSRSSFTFDVPPNGKYVRASVPNATASSCQITIGIIILPYEPYNPNSKTITIQLGDTYYGGKLDVVSGSYFDCDSTIQLSSIDSFSSDAVNANGYIRYNCIVSDKAQNFNIMCDKIKVINTTVGSDASSELISGASTNNRLYFTIDSTRLTGDLSTTSGRNQALKTLLQTDDIQIVYELATPTTIQLTPTAVSSLLGVNNIWADTGDVVEGQYFSKGE